jgi:hypothetical protein
MAMFAALGIVLLVAGAILIFAVDRSADGVDIVAVGWILMAGGGLSLLVAMIQAAGWMSTHHTTVHAERHVSDDGRHRVEEVRQG